MQVRDANVRRRGLALAAIITAFLQLAVAPNISLFSGHPNFCLAFAAYAALSIGGAQGVIVGFLSGLFFDLCATTPVGLMAFELCLMAYLLGVERRNRLADGLGNAVRLFALAAVIVEVLFFSALALVDGTEGFVWQLLGGCLPTIVLDIAVFAAYAAFAPRTSTDSPLFSGKAKLGAHERPSSGLTL